MNMAEIIGRLAALGAMLALSELIVAEGSQKQGVRFVGGLLTAGLMLEMCMSAARIAALL